MNTAAPHQPTTHRGRPLDVHAVARLTGLAVGTLRNMRSEGRGPKSRKLGGKVTYFEADVDRWIADAEAE